MKREREEKQHNSIDVVENIEKIQSPKNTQLGEEKKNEREKRRKTKDTTTQAREIYKERKNTLRARLQHEMVRGSQERVQEIFVFVKILFFSWFWLVGCFSQYQFLMFLFMRGRK